MTGTREPLLDRMAHRRMLRRWQNDPVFEPVFDVKTYHRAQWAWN